MPDFFIRPTRYRGEFKALHLHDAELLSRRGTESQARAESAEIELEARDDATP